MFNIYSYSVSKKDELDNRGGENGKEHSFVTKGLDEFFASQMSNNS